uniref:Ankyrin repeat and EF-hand domain containing 1a n=1 Tax=Gouania willdenowi TaxID=441366 RepID=A0A8C5EW99_GOUWI
MSHSVADDRLEVLQIYSLLQYIHKGDKERIKQIVEHGEAEKCAPLCFFMLEAGADPKAVNKTTGVTALMAASKAGSLQLVRAILKKGGDPNALSTERLSAVHLAAEVGSLEVIQVLSAYSANMQALTLKSCTALHYAAASGNANLWVGGDVGHSPDPMLTSYFSYTII